MLKRGFRAGYVSLALLVSACDSDDHREQSPVPPAASAATQAQGTQRDLSALDVCAILPDKVVATVLGNTITQPGRRQDYGQVTQGCE